MILGVCVKIIKQEIEPGVLFNVGVMVFCGSSECDVCKNSLDLFTIYVIQLPCSTQF